MREYRMWLALGATAALSLVGCGAPQQGGSAEASAEGVPVSAPLARHHYSTRAEPGGIRGGAPAEALAAEVRALLRGGDLTPDGRLAELAEWVGRSTQARQRPPDITEVAFMARRLGLVGPTPFTAVVPRDGETWRNLKEYVEALPANIDLTHFGVSVFRLSGSDIGAVAVAPVHVDLASLPRHVDAGSSVSLSGRLAPGYDKPELLWTRPDGTIRRTPMPSGPALDLVVAPLDRGEHQLEILAVGPAGLTVVANVPLYAGVAEPEPPSRFDGVDPGGEPAEALLELANAARARVGVAPLRVHEELSRIAQAHTDDMAANGFFGHRSPTTGEPEDRFRAAGFRLSSIGENVALGADARAAHAQLMDSPGHRANIENGVFTHIGLGVATDRRVEPPLLVFTQVFATLPSPIADPEATARELLDSLSDVREQHGLPRLEEDPGWSSAARQILRRAESNPKASLGTLAGQVRVRRRPGSPAPQILSTAVADPRELTLDAQMLAPGWRFAGVAVGAPREIDVHVGRTRIILIVGE